MGEEISLPAFHHVIPRGLITGGPDDTLDIMQKTNHKGGGMSHSQCYSRWMGGRFKFVCTTVSLVIEAASSAHTTSRSISDDPASRTDTPIMDKFWMALPKFSGQTTRILRIFDGG